ncbi:MAG: dockerin type I domain-containing protein [Candidatus Poribacteria bacterium]|nr:dockerin type I domain-containing protein [Candidatus Poribacteria bacterium]
MIYRRNSLPIWGVLVLLFVVSTGSAFAFSFGPPEGLTGALNEANCTQCHVGNALNDSDGSLMLTIPETYQPNEVYTIVVNLSRAGQSRWGFEMTALDDNGARAGSFGVSDAANTQLKEKDSKQYIMHTSAGSAQGTNDENQWTVEWTAPEADIGPITFYAAGNAANADFGITGDYIYTTSEESTPPVPTVAGVSLEIVGETARSTLDAIVGVSYTLKVTNTGNMMDTVTLEASAEVGIEGSVLGALSARSVELEAGASTEVTLKVTGDLFAKPGDYPINVTATSKTDGTKTAEVTTTTTIEMPPPPPTPWDVNDDGTVNVQDLVLVANELGESGESLKADVNGDGTVNILDLVLVASHFGEDTSN